MMNDRRVHAILGNGAEVVRYDRAGKYRIEPWGKRSRSYTMSIDWVFKQITAEGIKTWYPGVPGGTAFDKRLQKEYREFLRLKGIFGEMQVLGHPDAVRA